MSWLDSHAMQVIIVLLVFVVIYFIAKSGEDDE